VLGLLRDDHAGAFSASSICNMRLPPPEVVATWPPPNYINPETRGPALIIVELITLPLATICLALRLYVRFKVLNTSHWDDWMMVGAAVRSTVLSRLSRRDRS
jgi:hypothetical protein